MMTATTKTYSFILSKEQAELLLTAVTELDFREMTTGEVFNANWVYYKLKDILEDEV